MMLSQQAVDRFREIYQRNFGVVIDDADAREKAIDFMNFFRVICRPIPKLEIERK